MDYRLFKPIYRDRRTGLARQSPTWNIAFRDHLNRRQSLAAGRREPAARKFAERLLDLIECRRSSVAPADKLARWTDSLPTSTRNRLIAMDLIDQRAIAADTPLVQHVETWRQKLAADGGSEGHVNVVVQRASRIIAACGFVFFPDLGRPGADTAVTLHLGKERAAGRINGRTFNYYIRDLKSFCRWLAKQVGAAPPLSELTGVENDETDSDRRRALLVDEMRHLLAAAASGPVRGGLRGDNRAILYRFAFETGIRPNQIRCLTVGDFDLSSEPPTVTTHARYVKRRRPHVQVLGASLASELARRRFADNPPTAPALAMPSRYCLAKVLRKDLADARRQWIEAAGDDEVERRKRQRSDFLADMNHQGERAVFYSTRHGHGTALANAGVPEKDIAASMHHASRATTVRYLHSDRQAVARAIASMPDLMFAPSDGAGNGSDSTPDQFCIRNACATRKTPVEFCGESGRIGSLDVGGDSGVKSQEFAENIEFQQFSPRGGMADATDLKSVGP